MQTRGTVSNCSNVVYPNQLNTPTNKKKQSKCNITFQNNFNRILKQSPIFYEYSDQQYSFIFKGVHWYEIIALFL